MLPLQHAAKWCGWLACVGLFLAAADLPGQSAPTDQEWIGQRVVRTRKDVDLRAFNRQTGRTEVLGKVNTLDVRVDHVQGDWVWVRTPDKEGWVLKSDVILADRAIPYFTGKIQSNPNDAFAYSQRAAAYLQENQLQSALADMNQVLRLTPQDSSAWHNRGVVRHSLGEYDQALADYNEAIRLNPKDALFFNHRGEARHKQQAYDEAIADFTEAIRLMPKYAAAFANRGWAWLEKNELDIALADFRDAIKQDADLSSPYDGRARVYFKRGQYAEAAVEFEASLKRNPDQPMTHNNLGWARLNMKEYVPAIKAFDEAIRRDPNLASAYQGRYRVHYSQADYPAAREDCLRAIEHTPDSAVMHQDLAEIEFKLKDYEAAVAASSEAIRCDPKFVKAYISRSVVSRYLRNFDGAIADATEAIRLQPDSATAYLQRANCYRNMGDYRTALPDYDEAIRLAPESPGSYAVRGSARYLMGDYEAALADFSEAIRIDPKHPWAYNRRAMLYACASDPEYRDLSRAEESLQQARERQEPNADLYEVEAAVAAARGDFAAAVEFQEKTLAEPAYGLMPEQQARLALYQNEQPFLQERPADTAIVRTTNRPVSPAPPAPQGNPPAKVMPTPPPASAAADAAPLEGQWVCLVSLKNGEPVAEYVGVRAQIASDKLTWFFPRTEGGYREQPMKFLVDAAHDPLQMDIWSEAHPEVVDRRIFSQQGDLLTWGRNSDGSRPESFESAEWRFTCRRMQPENASPSETSGAPRGAATKPAAPPAPQP